MLGPFAVTLDGQPVPLPPSRETRALLACLALIGRPQLRERLCEIFRDVPDDPKGALRWSLSRIRRIIGADHAWRLRADRASVALDLSGAEVDAVRVLGRPGEAPDALPTATL